MSALPAAGGQAVSASGSADETPLTAPVVLFDFDGVLVCGDVMHEFLRRRYAASPWRWILVLASAPVLLGQMLASRVAMWATFGRLALLGMHATRYQGLVDDFAAYVVRRSGLCCRDGLRAMRHHMGAGERVLVVTTCEESLARAVFRELGLTEIEVLAAQWCDSWSGMRQALHNSGANKVRLLARHGLESCLTAYTDSLLDAPMLRLAAQAVLVNGTPARCKKLEQALGRTVSRVAWH